ncbi:ATP-binding protein [bacterium]|nr:ATP-binding protein [bacterium]
MNTTNENRNTMTLANIRKGKQTIPIRAILFAGEGVGKSTFAAGSPKPIFLGAEDGTAGLDIDRLPSPQTWKDVLDALRMLADEKHEYKTVVVDPVNWLESLVTAHIVGNTGKSLQDWGGGYGRGAAAAQQEWRVFVSELERIWRRGINILLLAHSQVKRFNDPSGAEYDRYEMAMLPAVAGLLKQWVDFVLFARFEAYATGDQKKKGISTGARLMHTAWNAAYDAKSRAAIPETLPLSWSAFQGALDNAGKNILNEIETALTLIGDSVVETAVRAELAKFKGDAGREIEILNALHQRIGEKAQ